MPKTAYRSKSKNIARLVMLLIVVLTAWLLVIVLRHSAPPPPTTLVISADTTAAPVTRNQVKDTRPALLKALEEAATELQAPGRNYSIKTDDAITSVRIPLDRTTMSLDYANAFVTAKAEKASGVLTAGAFTNSNNGVNLTFFEAATKTRFGVYLYYATSTPQKYKLAIVIDDFGAYTGELLDNFLALDKSITFAILPGLAHSKDVMNLATQQGRPAIIHIPMEPLNYPKANPGPGAIFINHSPEEITKRLTAMVTELPDCHGANNHMGSLVTADERTMGIVLDFLKSRDMFFIDSHTTNSSVVKDVAASKGISSLASTFFLDTPDVSRQTTTQKLERLAKLKEDGNTSLLVIGHCHKQANLTEILHFINGAQQLGYQLVPTTELGHAEVPVLP